MDKSMLAQLQIRNNANEMHSFMSDLNDWTDDIKRKDQKLRDGEVVEGKGFYELLDDDGDLLQDVNPEVMNEEELQEHAKTTAEKFAANQRIKPKTYQEYHQWDKFNVDDQLKDFDERERQEALAQKKKEQIERQRQKNEQRLAKRDKKQEADLLKEEGNDAFRSGKLEEALECYTMSILSNPNLFSTYSNRSAVLHKLGRDGDAETDADQAIKLNPRFTKAYLRRGAAREALGKMEEALKDFEHALTLEPCNRQTKKLMRKVKKSLGMVVEEPEDDEHADTVVLTKISVTEYGSDSEYEDDAATNAPTTKPSDLQPAHQPARKELLSQLVDPGELALPQSSTHFEHVWSNVLKGNLQARAAWLDKMGTDVLGRLFKQGIEAELFSGLLEVAGSCMPPQQAYEILITLSKTDRFDMNVMMASQACLLYTSPSPRDS
eukprot:TRINITY_DN11142_c0_g1_i20.p1 TRINITY_DN11142_c0_g1~~TRINITY_DN11142_c0_g1_i20.p1  ORF type:complete len:436 (+),score=154.28 TRINITY_DN11142_c0_g1_i20:191-1498(+)